jgi:hypothetical protein
LAEQWRYTSVEQLVEIEIEEDGANIVSSKKKRSSKTELEKGIQESRSKVAIRIQDALTRMDPDLDFGQVSDIIVEAFSLARRMSQQRCRMQIVFPNIGDSFVVGQPDLVSTYESEDVQTGTVALIVNPGLAKWGDSQGKMLDQRLDIIPSLVFVEPAVEKASPSTAGLGIDDDMHPEYEQKLKIKAEPA